MALTADLLCGKVENGGDRSGLYRLPRTRSSTSASAGEVRPRMATTSWPGRSALADSTA